MITTNRILALALVVAIAGASLGAAIMRSRLASRAETLPSDQTTAASLNNSKEPKLSNADLQVPAEFNTAEEQSAYKVGFADGFRASADSKMQPSKREAYRNAATTSSGSATRYEHAKVVHRRSFWDKHRDKLTVAMGTGGGALLGSFFGKKGAGIGALAGAGGSALYTYKLRKHR